MPDYLLVAAGSAIGGALRYGAYQLLAPATGFPWGTLSVNILGSFVIGWVAAANPAHSTRLLVMTGICGGFTTFSAFSLDAISMMREDQTGKAFAYIAASLVACLVATALAFRLRT